MLPDDTVDSQAAVWPSDGKGIAQKNKVDLHRARLVLRWETVHECRILVCNQPLQSTQISICSLTRSAFDCQVKSWLKLEKAVPFKGNDVALWLGR